MNKREGSVEWYSVAKFLKVFVSIIKGPIVQAPTSLLTKGQNYAKAPKKIPIEDIICSVVAEAKGLELKRAT